MAEPERPAISAWLSLVGMPNTKAAVAQVTMANMAALKAMIALSGSLPKSTILVMVSATLGLSMVITYTPRKLKIAAITMAARADIHRVTTQVAMALGASVQPFTRMTPSVNATATKSKGFWVI